MTLLQQTLKMLFMAADFRIDHTSAHESEYGTIEIASDYTASTLQHFNDN